MPNPTHSTQIKMLTEHCAQAMAWAMEGRPWISEARLGLGVAAHAVLEACAGVEDENAWYGVADSIVTGLSTIGYIWDGVLQQPINIEEAQQGASLAIRWIENHGPTSSAAHVEIGLSVDEAGNRCDYADGYLQAIIDVVDTEVIEDEEGCTETHLVVADYKSAWNADEALFDGLQAKIQATCAVAFFDAWDVLRMEIRNLRKGIVYTKEIRRDDEGLALLEQWKHDALQAAKVARRAAENPIAVPGAGCVGCPYCAVCDECEEAISSPDTVLAWVTAKAQQEALRPVVAKLVRESAYVGGAGWIGYETKARKNPARDAPQWIWDYWSGGSFPTATDDVIVGLLTAMDIGATQVRAVAKALQKAEGKEVAADFLDAALDDVVASELVVRKL